MITFFNFVRTDTQTIGDISVQVFRPAAKRFHGEASLIVSVDTDSRVRSISLTIHRLFVDDAETIPLARDLVKSFLANSLSAAGARQGSSLIAQIAGSSGPDDRRSTPTGGPDEGYATAFKIFRSGQGRVELTLGGDRLRMENITAPSGAPLLRAAIW